MARRKNEDADRRLVAIGMFQGLYARVAARVGVHPSYVSRVARGERKSPEVVAALLQELRVIRGHLNGTAGDITAYDGHTN